MAWAEAGTRDAESGDIPKPTLYWIRDPGPHLGKGGTHLNVKASGRRYTPSPTRYWTPSLVAEL